MQPYTERLLQRKRHEHYERAVVQHRLVHLAQGEHRFSARADGRMLARFINLFLVV